MTKEIGMETRDHSECDDDTSFSNSLRTRVPTLLDAASLRNAPQVDHDLKHE